VGCGLWVWVWVVGCGLCVVGDWRSFAVLIAVWMLAVLGARAAFVRLGRRRDRDEAAAMSLLLERVTRFVRVFESG